VKGVSQDRLKPGAGLFVLPVIGVYTAVVYWMFRGKQREGYTPTSAPPSTVKRS
jgi:cytochrome d ubiquinol oxidase subunit II